MRIKRFILLFSLLFIYLLSFNFATAAVSNNPTDGPLTFQARVEYQRAIEEVYWRHRIWPKENSGPKPSLEKILPDSAIISKVEDYLRKSNALEQYWSRPITAKQLQAEMDRMVRNTKQPKLLGELFTALNNDPHLIAECLARPAIVDRLIRNWYANDDRFHGELSQRVENELHGVNTLSMPGLSGRYSESERVKETDQKVSGNPAEISLNADEWNEWTDQLRGMFGKQIQTQKLSPILEDTDRFYVMSVLEKGSDRIKIAAVEWPKIELDSWWSDEKKRIPTEITEEFVTYSLRPFLVSSECIDDTWTPTQAPLPEAEGHLAVWTGTEMIVWGSRRNGDQTGGRYDPSTDSWTPMSTVNAPEPRSGPTTVWTGIEMILWGGLVNYESTLTNGGRYNPSTDSWTATSFMDGRFGHTAIWTGDEMIIWGGADLIETPRDEPNGHTAILTWSRDSYPDRSRMITDYEIVVFSNAIRYDPSTDSWTLTNTFNQPAARYGHTAVWTGNEMIVWGGINEIGDPFSTGARYDPSTDSWTATSNVNVPDARSGNAAVWTGAEMIIWGGSGYNTGSRYKPSTDSWTPTSNQNAPVESTATNAVWTGNEMIVWGGGTLDHYLSSGARYNPSSDTWTETSLLNAPDARWAHSSVWTQDEMIVWGGWGNTGPFFSGARYDPSTDSWTPTINTNVPLSRILNSAVWTGAEMIIWGGVGYHSDPDQQNLTSGARYFPATDSWTLTSTLNVPDGRQQHTAVWTGSEMIVWGGANFDGEFSSGGRYNPSTDLWTATSNTNPPEPRAGHTAVWTGSEVVIWGGSSTFTPLSSGGRYKPSTDSWTATSMANVPEARGSHTAVWTGSEMIIWGGSNSVVTLSSGGRYRTSTDSWTPTSTNAPEAASIHTAIWTGSKMIVWPASFSLSTGALYDPSIDSWTPTSPANAPEGRSGHSAVWTGTEMIIWGGSDLSSGARYDYSTDSWSATTIINVPEGRSHHSALWTGTQMIVWGGDGGASGSLQTGGLYCAIAPVTEPTIGISDISILEGKKGNKKLEFVITLSTPLDVNVKVDYSTADGTATAIGKDYVAKSGTKRIRRGQTTATIKVKIKGDRIVEEDEIFTVNLSNAIGAQILDPEGVGMILNDD